MMVKQAFQACLVALALGAATDARCALPITECGQTVPAHDRGIVQNDIVCDYRCSGDRAIVCGGDDDPLCDGKGRCVQEPITLERGAVLQLNGHELAADRTAIYCFDPAGGGRCTIKGPGHVSGGYAIVSEGLDVVVKNAAVSADRDAVHTTSHVTLIDTDLTGNLSFGGVQAGTGLKLVNVRTGGAEEMFIGGDVDLRNVELGEANEISATGTIRGRDVSMVGGAKLYGRSVVLRRATSSAGAGGDTRTSASGERSLKLVDSNVVKIASNQKPRLVDSTCEKSVVLDDRSSSWGVCSGD